MDIEFAPVYTTMIISFSLLSLHTISISKS